MFKPPKFVSYCPHCPRKDVSKPQLDVHATVTDTHHLPKTLKCPSGHTWSPKAQAV